MTTTECIQHGTWGDFCGPVCRELTDAWNAAEKPSNGFTYTIPARALNGAHLGMMIQGIARPSGKTPKNHPWYVPRLHTGTVSTITHKAKGTVSIRFREGGADMEFEAEAEVTIR